MLQQLLRATADTLLFACAQATVLRGTQPRSPSESVSLALSFEEKYGYLVLCSHAMKEPKTGHPMGCYRCPVWFPLNHN